MEQNNYPSGLCFVLAQNPSSMKAFINLSEAKQQEILQKSHAVSSKDEMQSLIDSLTAHA